MRRIFVLFLVSLVMAGADAQAGWIIKEKSDDGFGGVEISTLMFQGGKVKIDGQTQFVIFDSRNGALLLVQKDRNVHWKGTLQELMSRGGGMDPGGMGGGFESEEEGWGGSQNGMEGGYEPQDQGWGETEYDEGGEDFGMGGGFEVKRTSSSGNIAGARAIRTDILMEGQKVGEIWTSSQVSVNREVNYEQYLQLQMTLGDMVLSFCEMEPSLKQVLMQGYPVKAIFRLGDGMDMSREVVDI
jgi:hypothetical protein